MTKAKAEAKANMKAKASVAKVKAEILAKVEASVKAELEAAAKAERLRQEKVYRTLGPFRFCHQKGAKRGHVNAEELGRFQNSGFVLVLCEQSSMAATAGRQPTGLAQPLALDANVTPAKKEFPDEGALCYLASPSMQFVELAEKMLDVCSTGAVLALGQIALHEADHTRAGISSHGPSRLLPNGTLLGSLLPVRGQCLRVSFVKTATRESLQRPFHYERRLTCPGGAWEALQSEGMVLLRNSSGKCSEQSMEPGKRPVLFKEQADIVINPFASLEPEEGEICVYAPASTNIDDAVSILSCGMCAPRLFGFLHRPPQTLPPAGMLRDSLPVVSNLSHATLLSELLVRNKSNSTLAFAFNGTGLAVRNAGGAFFKHHSSSMGESANTEDHLEVDGVVEEVDVSTSGCHGACAAAHEATSAAPPEAAFSRGGGEREVEAECFGDVFFEILRF